MSIKRNVGYAAVGFLAVIAVALVGLCVLVNDSRDRELASLQKVAVDAVDQGAATRALLHDLQHENAELAKRDDSLRSELASIRESMDHIVVRVHVGGCCP